MNDFWNDNVRKNYLFADIYTIDTTVLRFRNWFIVEHEVDLIRSYGCITPTGDGNYERETTSEEDYLNNQDDNTYFSHIDYQSLIDRPDYNIICEEFETIINDSFIYDEQNLFLEFTQKSINQAQTDGQAKLLLKSILQTLDIYSKQQIALITDKTLNRLQEIIVEAYSFSYRETLTALVRRYDDIYEQITTPFKVNKPEKNQHEQPKQEKKYLHPQIFKANAYEVWQYMYDHFGVKESSRTDFKFMFEAMQHYGLIHTTVSQAAMLDWVNNIYQISIEKITPKKEFRKDIGRMKIFNEAKELYKEETT